MTLPWRPALRCGALLLSACLLAWPPEALAALLTSLRLSPTPERWSLTLDASAPLSPPAIERHSDFCRIRLPGLQADPELVTSGPDPLVKGLSWRQEGTDAVLEIAWQYPVPVATETDPDRPGRLTIHLERLFTEREPRPLASGLLYERIRRGLPHGPLTLYVLHLDRERLVATPSALSLAMGGDGTRFALETPSSMARRHGAIAAINGGYFARTGEPLGLVMRDRQLLSGPLFTRSLLAFGGSATPFVESTQMSGSIQLPNGESAAIDGLNQHRWDGQIVVYTSLWGSSTRTEPAANAVEYAVLASGQVIGRSLGNLAIPPGGYVVSASGPEADWLGRRVRVGDRLSYQTDLTRFWSGIDHILAGGPRLLAQGQPSLTTVDERFQPDVAVGRAPRTAVGITPQGGVILLVADGRQPRHSVGLTLPETADVMQELGATEALNLDGGGSSVMVIDGLVVNRPSDGRERPVSNALLVF